MNMNKKARALVVEQFVERRRSIAEVAEIYGKSGEQIEQIIRESLIVKVLDDHIAGRGNEAVEDASIRELMTHLDTTANK